MEPLPERSSLEDEEEKSVLALTESKDFKDENKYSFRVQKLKALEDCDKFPDFPKVDISKLEP